MLRALIESAGRFVDKLAPLGYEKRSINWVLDIDPETGKAHLSSLYNRRELEKDMPTRGDRAGTPSDENLKPALLVDNRTYALGIAEADKEEVTDLVHKGFIKLLEDAYTATQDPEVQVILQFLKKPLPPEIIQKLKKPREIVAFRCTPERFPFERDSIRHFWADYLRQEYTEGQEYCASCGQHKPIVRILPWQVSFFGYSCPISSFNATAFESMKKEQTRNSPLCFECAGTASQVLQYLVDSERHSAVLARDDSKGEGKQPLRNHLAIFWLKEEIHAEMSTEGIEIDFEALLKKPIEDQSPPENGPPPELEQLRRLLNLPWTAGSEILNLSKNSFYLAVLSPNKSRLVVRDWLEESLDSVWGNLKKFVAASSIVHPDGEGIWFPPIPAILGSLKPEKTKSATSDPNLLRGLLRTAYQGYPPPHGLLESAVYRFRIPDKPSDKIEERRQQKLRRMALAAVMKLVLTYAREEARTMEQLDERHKTSPYLCGRLLAVLEEIQQRASGWQINATLVDRYYGAASTAPATVFPNLIKLATTAHLPKLRKEMRGHKKMGSLLEEVTSLLDEAGGFSSTLTLKEQADFALGFYHQKAEFNKERKAKSTFEGVDTSKPRGDGK